MFFKVLFMLLFSIVFITSCGGNKKTTKTKIFIEKDDDVSNERLTNSLNIEDFKFFAKETAKQLKESDLIQKAMKIKGNKLTISISHLINKTLSYNIALEMLKSELSRSLLTIGVFNIISSNMLRNSSGKEKVLVDFEFKGAVFEENTDNSYKFSYKLIDLKTKKIFYENKVVVKKKKVRVMHRTL